MKPVDSGISVSCPIASGLRQPRCQTFSGPFPARLRCHDKLDRAKALELSGILCEVPLRFGRPLRPIYSPDRPTRLARTRLHQMQENVHGNRVTTSLESDLANLPDTIFHRNLSLIPFSDVSLTVESGSTSLFERFVSYPAECLHRQRTLNL